MSEGKSQQPPRRTSESAAQRGRSEPPEVREPLVDIFEAEDYLLVQAEVPGIGKRDVRIEFKDDVLSIFAQRGGREYRKEVLLPRDLSPEKMRISCRNGILEIKCFK